MTTLVRFTMVAFVALAATPMAFAAACCEKDAAASSGCKKQKEAKPSQGSCPMHRSSGCCGKGGKCCAATQWADPANVSWTNKLVSFGNYMKMAKAEIPAPVCPPTMGPIFFDFDKSDLRAESVTACEQLVEYLKANPRQTVRVEGNCCDIGTKEYNKKLGARRAAAVKKYLVGKGIDAKRIKTVSFGEEKPKYPVSQREKNRRDDFVIQCMDAKK